MRLVRLDAVESNDYGAILSAIILLVALVLVLGILESFHCRVRELNRKRDLSTRDDDDDDEETRR